jgi:hypothetical protein
VRAIAAARKERELSQAAALVSEIAGRPARPLPAGVAAALESLEAASSRSEEGRALPGAAPLR